MQTQQIEVPILNYLSQSPNSDYPLGVTVPLKLWYEIRRQDHSMSVKMCAISMYVITQYSYFLGFSLGLKEKEFEGYGESVTEYIVPPFTAKTENMHYEYGDKVIAQARRALINIGAIEETEYVPTCFEDSITAKSKYRIQENDLVGTLVDVYSVRRTKYYRPSQEYREANPSSVLVGRREIQKAIKSVKPARALAFLIILKLANLRSMNGFMTDEIIKGEERYVYMTKTYLEKFMATTRQQLKHMSVALEKEGVYKYNIAGARFDLQHDSVEELF